MLLLLRNEVSADYEKFGIVSKTFRDRSDDIRQSMEQLQQKTKQYAKSLKTIKDAMLSVSAASEENSGEISNTSQLLLSIDEDMKDIGISTEETLSAVSKMKNELNGYRV